MNTQPVSKVECAYVILLVLGIYSTIYDISKNAPEPVVKINVTDEESAVISKYRQQCQHYWLIDPHLPTHT